MKIPFSDVLYIFQNEDGQTSDHCFIRSKKLSQPTKKLDCPLVFTVKKLLRFPEYRIQKNTQRNRTEMAAKLKKEITALSSAKNDLPTFTKDEENKNSIKPLGRLEYICKFPDPNGHENHHVGEAATIREPLDERVVEFSKIQIRSGFKRIKELQRQMSILVNDVIFAHEKSQNLTGGNSDQTTK